MKQKSLIAFLLAATLALTGCVIPHAGGDKTILVDLEVTLDGSASKGLFGQKITCAWDFGDGTTVTGAVVKHKYDAVGDYTAMLTVTDEFGWKDTSSVTVKVMGWEMIAVPISVGSYTIDNPVMEFLPNGQMVILDGDSMEIVKETDSSTETAREFEYITTIPADSTAGFAWGSFVKAINDQEIIVGTSVELFKVDLDAGTATEIGDNLPNYGVALSDDTLYTSWGVWGEDSRLSEVDINTGTKTDLITDIPGASGGVALDGSGNIYTGNGYHAIETGEIRQFDLSIAPEWAWYADSTLVGDILSAGSLIWVGNDIMLVGGGEWGVDDNYFTALDIDTGITLFALDPDEDTNANSVYTITGGKESNMISAIAYGGNFYVLPFSALGL